MNGKAKEWIEVLGLVPHPEGGYFKETYRSAEEAPAACLPRRFDGPRSFSTAIYFLLEGTQVSAFHRFRSDEVWHYHEGSSLEIHVIDPAGTYSKLKLGLNAQEGERPQATVPAQAWVGARLTDISSFALVSCTVSPGFDFRDFEPGTRRRLLEKFPEHRQIIQKLTPDS